MPLRYFQEVHPISSAHSHPRSGGVGGDDRLHWCHAARRWLASALMLSILQTQRGGRLRKPAWHRYLLYRYSIRRTVQRTQVATLVIVDCTPRCYLTLSIDRALVPRVGTQRLGFKLVH